MIDDLVGKPFSFMDKIMLRGVGSKRMMVEAVSSNMVSLLNTVADLNYANIELRPAGVLVRINKGLENYTWVIPYYHLAIYKTERLSVHAQGKYIQFKNNRLVRENKSFFEKLWEEKAKHDAQYSFY